MRHMRTIILVLLIVSVLVVSCDAQVTLLTQDQTDTVAGLSFLTLLHTMIYVAEQIDIDQLEVIPEEGDNEITVKWIDFDFGASVAALLDGNDLSPEKKAELPNFISPNDLIINGTATAIIDIGKVDVNMTLKINSPDPEEVPSGTYTVVMALLDFGLGDDVEPDIEIKVNGVRAILDL